MERRQSGPSAASRREALTAVTESGTSFLSVNRRYRTQYLQSAHWKRRKSRYFAKHGRWCAACNTKRRIDLHHLSYQHVGNESDGDLMGFCRQHHALAHKYWDSGRYKTIRQATSAMIAKVRHGKRHESVIDELLALLFGRPKRKRRQNRRK